MVQLSVELALGRAPRLVAALASCAVWLFACSDAAPFGTQRVQADDESVNPTLADETDATSGETAEPSSSVAPVPAPSIDEVGDPFEEQQCPEAVQRIESSECDPLGGPEQCAADEGCYPYVQYPSSRCEPETFGTRCDTAGPGAQGDPCTGQRCAHGFLCVVTGRGTECAALCRMPGPNTCRDGLICGSLDIDGFGVCI